MWVLPVLLVGVVAFAGLGCWGYTYYQRSQQKKSISNTITAFAEASDTVDTKKLASLMCEAEAEEFLDGFEGQEDPGPIKPAKRRPVDIGPIVITDDDATVDVTRSPLPTVTFKLKRESGVWKLCNPGS